MSETVNFQTLCNLRYVNTLYFFGTNLESISYMYKSNANFTIFTECDATLIFISPDSIRFQSLSLF